MIAVDWGGSSLRAYRLDDDGVVRDRRRAEIGALGCAGQHAQKLDSLFEGWDDDRVVLCGMVGGRGGWREVPYVECPASTEALAAGMVRVDPDGPDLRGRTVHIVPGAIDRHSSPVADVMRGEETQVVGLMHARGLREGVICLPGTHSKWVQVREGSIRSIRTAMTGEVYALLRRDSVLSRLMEPGDEAFDEPAFDAGLRRSRDPGGLLHHLFGVRTQGLLGTLSSAQSPSYLSGLLIGHELGALPTTPRHVHLVANERLAASYARALRAAGIETEIHAEQLAAIGMHALYRASTTNPGSP